MGKSYTKSSSDIESYVEETFHPEDQVLVNIRARAAKAGLPDIHVGRMDGLHLEVFVRALGAKKIVEIGTLAGYSATCMARGLPVDGRLYTFEFEPKHAEVAMESFREAKVDKKVEIFVGAALTNLIKINDLGPFDLVFIDANKDDYPHYLEWAVQNLRVGGAILADNTFAGGTISDPSPNASERTRALRQFNAAAASHPHLRSTILPTSDGLTFAVKI